MKVSSTGAIYDLTKPSNGCCWVGNCLKGELSSKKASVDCIYANDVTLPQDGWMLATKNLKAL